VSVVKLRKKPLIVDAVQYGGHWDLTAAGIEWRYQHWPPTITEIWVAKSRAWCELARGDWAVREFDGDGWYPLTDAARIAGFDLIAAPLVEETP
jgi:hypothetical protein